MAAAHDAAAEEADGVVAEAQGAVPEVRQSTDWAADRTDQSDPSGMGELLCGGALESVLLVYQRLGREKGPAASDAGSETARFRLAAMESGMAVPRTRFV